MSFQIIIISRSLVYYNISDLSLTSKEINHQIFCSTFESLGINAIDRLLFGRSYYNVITKTPFAAVITVLHSRFSFAICLDCCCIRVLSVLVKVLIIVYWPCELIYRNSYCRCASFNGQLMLTVERWLKNLLPFQLLSLMLSPPVNNINHFHIGTLSLCTDSPLSRLLCGSRPL